MQVTYDGWMRKNEFLFWIIVVLCLTHHFWISRDLPDVVASHFGAGGRANGFSSRDGHVFGMLVIYGLMALSFGILPLLLKWIPHQLINLPHREYWLAPERRQASLDRVRDWMAMMGVAVFFFFMVVNRMVVEANKMVPPQLPDAFLWALGLFMAFTIGWTVVLFLAFRKPKPELQPKSPSSRKP